MTVGDWVGIGGFVVALISLITAYFSITNEAVRRFFIKRGMGNLSPVFAALADEYQEADRIPDDPAGPVERPKWDSRIRKKDVVAEGLCRFAQGAGLDRRTLAALQGDGYVVALMKLITAEPREGDVWLIAQAVECNVPSHADYRTLEAVDALAGRGLISLQERNEVDKIVDRVAVRLGSEGASRIEWTRAHIRNPTSKP